MALPLSNTFETGLADETALTLLNSDDGAAGDAFSTLTLNSGSIVYDDTPLLYGSTLSARYIQSGVGQIHVEWTNIGAVAETWGRVYIYRTGNPAGSDTHWVVRWADAATTRLGQMYFNNTGRLFVQDSLSATASTTASIPLNEWIRIEFHFLCSATVGRIEARIYEEHSTTLYVPALDTGASVNTGTEVSAMRIGQGTGFATGGQWWMDNFAVNATGWPGAAASPPTSIRSEVPPSDFGPF